MEQAIFIRIGEWEIQKDAEELGSVSLNYNHVTVPTTSVYPIKSPCLPILYSC